MSVCVCAGLFSAEVKWAIHLLGWFSSERGKAGGEGREREGEGGRGEGEGGREREREREGEGGDTGTPNQDTLLSLIRTLLTNQDTYPMSHTTVCVALKLPICSAVQHHLSYQVG